MPISKASEIGDIFVTVTGDKNVISFDHMKKMRDGVILANSGHFNAEIELDTLEKNAKKTKIRASMDQYNLNGRKLFVLGEGRLINLAAAEGHPSEIMSLSFMNQALAMEYIVKNKDKLQSKVYVLPKEIDNDIALVHLQSLGIEIDTLTAEQKKYLSSWKEGT